MGDQPAFCTACGAPLQAGARFCSFCGHAVSLEVAGNSPEKTVGGDVRASPRDKTAAAGLDRPITAQLAPSELVVLAGEKIVKQGGFSFRLPVSGQKVSKYDLASCTVAAAFLTCEQAGLFRLERGQESKPGRVQIPPPLRFTRDFQSVTQLHGLPGAWKRPSRGCSCPRHPTLEMN